MGHQGATSGTSVRGRDVEHESMTQMVDGLASAIALLAAVSDPPESPEKFERLLEPLIEACGEDEPLKRRTLELLRQRIRAYAG